MRFEFLWEFMSKGSRGTVILFDITSKTFTDEINFFINRFRDVLLTSKCIVGISKYSESYSDRVIEILDLINDSNVPVIAVDIRNKEDVLKLLALLIE